MFKKRDEVNKTMELKRTYTATQYSTLTHMTGLCMSLKCTINYTLSKAVSEPPFHSELLFHPGIPGFQETWLFSGRLYLCRMLTKRRRGKKDISTFKATHCLMIIPWDLPYFFSFSLCFPCLGYNY